jgi:hypothetical protein
MQTIEDSFKLLIGYLDPNSVIQLNYSQLEEMYDNFLLISWSEDKYQEEISKIKDLLNTETQNKRYECAPKSIRQFTVHAWLEDIHIFNKNQKLADYLEKTSRIRRLRTQLWNILYLYSSVYISALAYSLIFDKLMLLETLLAAALASSELTSIVGLIYHIARACYLYFYQKQKYDFPELTREIMFLLIEKSLKIFAYLVILTAINTNPCIVGLFVISELVVVFKEILALYQLPAKPEKMDSHQNIQTYCDLQEKKQKIVINLIAALAMTAVVAFWVFCPGSTLIISIIAVLAIALIYGIQTRSLNQIDQQSRTRAHGFFDNYEKNEPFSDPAENNFIGSGLFSCLSGIVTN